MADQGNNWAQDRFYHGLEPSLRDALEFAMAELPEREQVGASFDTLYMLAKKMEARQPSHTHRGQGSLDHAYRDRYWRYPTPAGRVATLADEGILPPDPEPLEQCAPKLDVIEGLSMRMTQVMNHYQWEEHRCFVCRSPDHFGTAPIGIHFACGKRSSLMLKGQAYS